MCTYAQRRCGGSCQFSGVTPSPLGTARLASAPATRSGNRQAARFVSLTAGGTVVAQTCGSGRWSRSQQRGWNGIRGRARRAGGSPRISAGTDPRLPTLGTAASSARRVGMTGIVEDVVGDLPAPRSAPGTSPRSVSLRWRTTPRSCEMSRYVRPWRARSSRSRFRICAWTDTSRADVGSSRTMQPRVAARGRGRSPPAGTGPRRARAAAGRGGAVRDPPLREGRAPRARWIPAPAGGGSGSAPATRSRTLIRGSSEPWGSWKTSCISRRRRRSPAPLRSGDVAAVDLDPPGRGLDQPEDAPGQRRLA